jgi:large subunit ribosomal protein L31
MKAKIHPEYKEINVICSCGSKFKTRSTMGKDIHVEVCAECHPFYTGVERQAARGGRIARFERRRALAAG